MVFIETIKTLNALLTKPHLHIINIGGALAPLLGSAHLALYSGSGYTLHCTAVVAHHVKIGTIKLLFIGAPSQTTI